MSPEYVQPYVKAQKIDDRDAEGIAEAVTRSTMRVVTLKIEAQLDLQEEVCRAPSAETAGQALTAFEAGLWGTRYPVIGQSWRRAWAEVIPFFAIRRRCAITGGPQLITAFSRRAPSIQASYETFQC